MVAALAFAVAALARSTLRCLRTGYLGELGALLFSRWSLTATSESSYQGKIPAKYGNRSHANSMLRSAISKSNRFDRSSRISLLRGLNAQPAILLRER